MRRTLSSLLQGHKRDTAVSKLVDAFKHVFIFFCCVKFQSLLKVSNCLFIASCKGNPLWHVVFLLSFSPKSLSCYIETMATDMAEAPSSISVAKRCSYNVVIEKFLDLEADVKTLGLTCSDSSEVNDNFFSNVWYWVKLILILTILLLLDFLISCSETKRATTLSGYHIFKLFCILVILRLLVKVIFILKNVHFTIHLHSRGQLLRIFVN